MKKIFAAFMAMVLTLSLAACGGSAEKPDEKPAEAPDLNAFYESYMNGMIEEMGEENAPMLMELDSDMLNAFYAGLTDISTKQLVAYAAAISAVAYEIVMVEVENAEDVEKVQTIFEARKQAQADGGAMYPATCEAWESAEVITHGNVIALIATGEDQAKTADAFNALFA